jgi:hypothetical protein
LKKLILSLVFVLATGSIMNANNSIENNSDCLADAWDYGTELGTSDYGEWFYMNEYYETHCVQK